MIDVFHLTRVNQDPLGKAALHLRRFLVVNGPVVTEEP